MSKAPAQGKLVVVGGHSRRVGKTCMMEAILHATPGMAWHALKISSHAHGARPDPARASGSRAELLSLRDDEFPAGVRHLEGLLDEGCNLLVESNRIVSYLRADLVIFVVDPLNLDWKPSSAACLGHADALVFSEDGPGPAPLIALRKILPAFRMSSWDQAPLGFAEWFGERLRAVEVTSQEAPLAGFSSHDSPVRGSDGHRPRAHQPTAATPVTLISATSRT